jgi:hypothetical protein
MIAPEVVSSQHIGMLPMVCRYPKLDDANVPHGLGVHWGILLACHGLFFMGKKTRSKKNSPRQNSYLGIRKKHTVFPPF